MLLSPLETSPSAPRSSAPSPRPCDSNALAQTLGPTCGFSLQFGELLVQRMSCDGDLGREARWGQPNSRVCELTRAHDHHGCGCGGGRGCGCGCGCGLDTQHLRRVSDRGRRGCGCGPDRGNWDRDCVGWTWLIGLGLGLGFGRCFGFVCLWCLCGERRIHGHVNDTFA